MTRREIVIDRLEVEFFTAKATQAWRIRERLGSHATRVEGLDNEGNLFPFNEKSTPVTTFRATFQDHQSAGSVLEALRRCDLVGVPKIVMLEVALDTYIQGADARGLSKAAVDMYRFLESPPAERWHAYRKKGEGAPEIHSSDVLLRRDLEDRFASGWNVADTPDKSADKRFHIYVKTHDYSVESEETTPLPMDQWRARIEVTLRGSMLPAIDDAGTLESLDLTKLTEHFRFREFAKDLHPAARLALDRESLQPFGQRGHYSRPDPTCIMRFSGHPTMYRGSTQANIDLNEFVRAELRRVNRQWRKPIKTPPQKAPSAVFRTNSEPPKAPRQKMASAVFRTTLETKQDVKKPPESPIPPMEKELLAHGGECCENRPSNNGYHLTIQIEPDGSTSLHIIQDSEPLSEAKWDAPPI